VPLVTKADDYNCWFGISTRTGGCLTEARVAVRLSLRGASIASRYACGAASVITLIENDLVTRLCN